MKKLKYLIYFISVISIFSFAGWIHYLAGGWSNVIVSFSIYGGLILFCTILLGINLLINKWSIKKDMQFRLMAFKTQFNIN